jgi:hypothetical protein
MTSDRRECKEKTCCADPTQWDKGTMMIMSLGRSKGALPSIKSAICSFFFNNL